MNIYMLGKKNNGESAAEKIVDFTSEFERKKQRKHELWILTCYVDLDLLEKYADQLMREVRLTDIYLAFNFSEIYKIGAEKTNEKLFAIAERLKTKEIAFEWRILTSENLVHSKAYALIQRVNDELTDGVTLVTSANFTEPGFYGKNIEIGYFSTKKKDLVRFIEVYDELWNGYGGDISGAISKERSYNFKYAVLASGVFLHKWSENLRQQIGIKYRLTPNAKEKGTIAPELEALGFEAGDTFTRQVLDITSLPEKEIPRLFIMRFTIETYWGRWCPVEAWEIALESCSCDEHHDIDKFILQFRKATEGKVLDEVIERAVRTQSELVEKNLIEPVEKDHLDRWKDRILGLRENRPRLERFFTGYEAHALPYSIEQTKEVADLFENLMETIELAKATSIVKEKLKCAVKNMDVNSVNLMPKDQKIIKDIMQNKKQ